MNGSSVQTGKYVPQMNSWASIAMTHDAKQIPSEGIFQSALHTYLKFFRNIFYADSKGYDKNFPMCWFIRAFGVFICAADPLALFSQETSKRDISNSAEAAERSAFCGICSGSALLAKLREQLNNKARHP